MRLTDLSTLSISPGDSWFSSRSPPLQFHILFSWLFNVPFVAFLKIAKTVRTGLFEQLAFKKCIVHWKIRLPLTIVATVTRWSSTSYSNSGFACSSQLYIQWVRLYSCNVHTCSMSTTRATCNGHVSVHECVCVFLSPLISLLLQIYWLNFGAE